jgi:hypothetical protein
MKKRLGKLRLNRETLRHLQTGDYRQVVGGDTGDTSCVCIAATGCECATETGCPGTHLLTQPCTLESRCVC